MKIIKLQDTIVNLDGIRSVHVSADVISAGGNAVYSVVFEYANSTPVSIQSKTKKSANELLDFVSYALSTDGDLFDIKDYDGSNKKQKKVRIV